METEKIIGSPTGNPCPKCGTPLVWKTGRYSTFQACPEYPRCDGKIGAPRGRSARKPEAPAPAPATVPAYQAPAQEAPVAPVETAQSTKPQPLTPEQAQKLNPGDLLLCIKTGGGSFPDKMVEAGKTYTFDRIHQEAGDCLCTREMPDYGFYFSRFTLMAHTNAPPPTHETVTEHEHEESENTEMPNPDLGGALWQAIKPAFDAHLETRASEIASRVAAEAVAAAKNGLVKIDYTVNDKPFAHVEGTHHKAMDAVLLRVRAGLKNILLVGPAGCGKTQLAQDIAKAVGREFACVSCTAGMSESALTGRNIPNLQTGKTEFQGTDFVRLYENGGVFLLDEFDAGDPNVMLVINSALANGHMSVPNRADNQTAKRHPDFVLIAAANTWGNGASRMYVGRNQLDASTMSRFAGAVIEVDYDRELEAQLVTDNKLRAAVWHMRDKVNELKLRQVMGTRELISAARLLAAGMAHSDIYRALTVSWTPDERSKVGVS